MDSFGLYTVPFFHYAFIPMRGVAQNDLIATVGRRFDIWMMGLGLSPPHANKNQGCAQQLYCIAGTAIFYCQG